MSQAESAVWHARTTALRNAEQIAETAQHLAAHRTEVQTLLNATHRRRSSPLVIRALRRLNAKLRYIINELRSSDERQRVRIRALNGHLLAAQESIATLRLMVESQSLNQPGEALAQQLRQQLHDFQSQVAQRLLILEAREAERETHIANLSATMHAQLTEQGELAKDRWNESAKDTENALATFTQLSDRIDGTEHALRALQQQVAAIASDAGECRKSTSHTIKAIATQLSRLPDSDTTLVNADDLPRSYLQLIGRLEDIEGRITLEQEGFAHWAKGLRESFGSELSSVRAKLTERYTELEHRYAALEHGQLTTAAMLHNFDLRLANTDKLRINDDPDCHDIGNRVQSVLSRLEEIDARDSGIIERLTGCIRENEEGIAHALEEIASIKILIEALPTVESSFITSAIECGTHPLIEQVEATIASQLNARIQRFEEEHIHSTEARRDAVHGLEYDLDAPKRPLREYSESSQINSVETLRDSVTAASHKLEKQFAATLAQSQERCTAQAQLLEKAISDLHEQIGSVRELVANHLVDPKVAISCTDVENRLNLNIELLRFRLEEHIARFDLCNTEIAAIHRQLQSTSAGVTETGSGSSAALESGSPSIDDSNSTGKVESSQYALNLPRHKPTVSRGEQLQELQERMSAEIERVRAELKERSGRWKVRKSGS
jgi:hypothetical protein